MALVAAMLSYVAAALMLMGFVPERLPLGRTVLVQFAGSFVKLVAPAAVSGVAINTRYLQKRGIPPGQAVASVGASQLIGLAFHIALLLLFAYVTGSNAATSFTPSRTLVITLLAAAVLIVVIMGVPPLRRLIIARLRSLFSGVIPRLLDVLQSPRKIIAGLHRHPAADDLLRGLPRRLRPAPSAAPSASPPSPSSSSRATRIGSAAPTPGGLGAVEGALSLGLTLSGLPDEVATSAVLLFRLLTFWLPVLPGWASFTYLQRHEAL